MLEVLEDGQVFMYELGVCISCPVTNYLEFLHNTGSTFFMNWFLFNCIILLGLDYVVLYLALLPINTLSCTVSLEV